VNQQPHRWSSDREGKHPDDDKLGRLEFAQRVAKELRGWRHKESLVVSLNGDWGSGKTTLVNLVLHYVAEQSTVATEAKPVVVRFNPWQWSGQDMLFEAFFTEIGDTLGRERPGKDGVALAQKWNRFGALSGVGRATAQLVEVSATALAASSLAAGSNGVAAGAATSAGIANWLKNIFSGGQEVAQAASDAHGITEVETVDEVRTDLRRMLLDMPAPLIVVIDDIDRLTKEQVRMLVQLVKANADFANVVYLLLYQKNIVARALDEVTCERGQDFLKKIVQVELEVPGAPDHRMREMLTKGLNDIWGRVRLRWDPERQERWRRLFEDAVWPYFETPRDIKRFLGVLDFYFEGHTDGDVLTVNPVDLVLIEALRMFDAEAFDAVRRSFQKGRNVFIEVLFDDKEAKAKFALSIDHLIDGRDLAEREKKRLRALLYGLFPQASEHGRDSSNHDNWDRDYRICHHRHFPKYFQLHADPGDVPARFIAKFFDEENGRDECRNLIQEAIDQGQFQAMIERLWIMHEDFPEARVTPVVEALLDLTDCLPEIKAGTEFAGDAERELARLAHRLLPRIEDTAVRDAAYLKIIEGSRALSGPVFLTGYLEPDEERRNPRDQIISIETLGAAKAILLPRIWAAIATPTFWNLRLARMLVYRLRDWAGIEAVRGWLIEAIKDPVVARKFFRHMLHETHSSSGGRSTTIYSLPAMELETFADLSILLQKLLGQQLDRLEAVAVEKLQTAIERKAKGESYSRIPILAYDEAGNESTNSHDLRL
jgi:hypothetical protein